jgi:hypothetical protein
MTRFEDDGLTLRLFVNLQDAKHAVGHRAFQVAQYGPGALIKGRDGRWHDAHGRLPEIWTPKEELLKVAPTLGFYVDNDGVTCSADVPAPGLRFELRQEDGYQMIWLVRESDDEVVNEYVLHPTIQALIDAGVDVEYVPPRLVP